MRGYRGLTLYLKFQRKKESLSVLKKLQKFIEKLDKEFTGVVKVFINNPCLEFWFLLHFRETGKFFNNCDNVEKELKRDAIPGYEKTERYFKGGYRDIYYRLKQYQKSAIKNAAKLGNFNFDIPDKSISEMHRVLDELFA